MTQTEKLLFILERGLLTRFDGILIFSYNVTTKELNYKGIEQKTNNIKEFINIVYKALQ
jgi:hypothetical protein